MPDRIKLFVTDIDGTMTSGHMVFDHEGNVSKGYHTRDVTALWLLKNAGIRVLVLTGSNHACDRHRFHFLTTATGDFESKNDEEISEVLSQGVHDKRTYLNEYLTRHGISWDEVAFIGDAENDYECLMSAGWSACPKDAEDDIRRVSQFVSSRNGGQCAVKEFADLVISTMARLHGKGK